MKAYGRPVARLSAMPNLTWPKQFHAPGAAGAQDGRAQRRAQWGIFWGYNSNWVNYNDLTASSLEIMVSKGKYPQMTLFQVSELI